MIRHHLFASALCLNQFLLLSSLVANTCVAQEQPQWSSLLSSIDPQQSLAGQWQKTPSGLTTNAAAGARITIPFRPEGEYDFRVRFTRTTGSNSIALIFVAGGRQASLDIDGWGQHLSGFQQIGSRDMRQYRDRVGSVTLRNGQAYTAVVQVRKNEIRADLDDKLLHSHRTDGSDLSMLNLWKMSDTRSLGLGAWDSATTFHSVEVRSVNGAPMVASATPRPVKPDPTIPPPRIVSDTADDIASLSDEFNDPGTLTNWLRVFEVERTGADQLQRFDIGRSQQSAMTLMPYTSTWYRDYRGVLVHKRVRGDFVVTTRVRTSGRSGRGAPGSQFSLAGIMVRTPRNVTPQTWRTGAENYIFLSHGSARQPGTYQMEVKTTINSNSNLEISNTQHAETEIRVARLGQHFVLLRREPRGRWMVHRRYHRPDMPEELQVGMTVYTDYPNASRSNPATHNRTVVRNGNPDLIATFDYFRFQRPQVPSALRGRALSNPSQVNDANLLQFLGESLTISGPGESN